MSTLKADDIKHLDQIVHVRKRVGMYLGGNSHEGLTTGLREGIDNSVDEVLAGYNDKVIVRFFPDNSAEVQDYGRGLPVDKNKNGVNGIILTVGTIGSGGKFSGKTISGGLHGVGISAMNAASARFDVTVYRDGKKYSLSFKEGKPGHFATPDDPAAKFTPSTEIKTTPDSRSAAEKKKNPTGTIIKFWPDYTVFLPESRFDVEDIKKRLKATCFLIPEMTGIVEDYRENPQAPIIETYHFNAGIVDMLPTLSPKPLQVKPIYLSTKASFVENTNVLQENDEMKQEEVERPVDIEVVFAYTDSESTFLNSYVNIIQTAQHGTHVDGLWRALSREITKVVKDGTFSKLRAKEEPPTMDDIREGFVGIVSVKFPEPTFNGQAKSALTTPQMTALASQAIGEAIKNWFGEKRNATQAKILTQKIIENKRIREAAKAQKDVARKKSALETASSLPAKLVAAAVDNPEEVDLLLCEGNSALGGLKSARDANKVAIYPLRGKPLNAYTATLSAVLQNAEWADLIQIIGAGVGKEFDVGRMRYRNIIIVADQDDDGSHIAGLLIAGFWKLMRPLVEAGRLCVAIPPLYSITTGGKNAQRYYALDDEGIDKIVKDLAKKKIKYDKVVRHKGLSEYSPEILEETVMNENTRVLKQLTIDDLIEFEKTLELTMGKNADARRDWIVEHRQDISDEEVDY